MVRIAQVRGHLLRDGQGRLGVAMESILEGAPMPLKEREGRSEDRHDLFIRLEFAVIAVMMVGSLLSVVVSFVWPSAAIAHPGGLAADGCHNDRKNGGRHCHRTPPTQSRDRQSARTDVYYANCAAARAAGAAPVRSGDPGYARHLDRDGDGIGCE